MDTKQAFGNALRMVRKQRRITQEDFSEVSSRTYLSSLERGIKNPTIDKVVELSGVLGVHPLTLLCIALAEAEGAQPEAVLSRVEKELQGIEL
ncbi:helix-turn-helix domain-containing protein [Pseudomonas aeruginosa]|uniref:helix-turn-helix domain-containing protein n=1 Tax=Pseudomonas aeruginosa TaxID=287 RepID=UPI000EB08E5F|nr:helix-turn-helix transcriptional regulator [Pseudomonas aeruginosa]EIU1413931.1 helix-turn-helix transcriptional regulator [Pseudomonas aeruginosa]MCG9956516.1 helix-turn-helix domain-containing protein [Pseudomonas aeruginosa]MCS7968633.1 helix-turn-helix domain-containing protein [Pseudomonas aeruginosa]MCS8135134.1 helix-turn-helix domain-containing protein [Pseudomonas aeruginosa]MCS8177486.1 helix-turn-helix domain-containing protein [Pseudomonas aeruginosa]